MTSRVDRLREAIDAFSRGADLGTYADLIAPDFELHQSSSIIDTAGVFRGPNAPFQPLRELSESFEEMTFEAERYLEAPGGEVVVLIHTTGRGRGSGLEVDNHIAWVWTFRDDQAVRMVVYEEPAEALRSLGLTPDA